MAVEWYLYGFDALLMVGVMAAFNVCHPGRLKKYQGKGGRGGKGLVKLDNCEYSPSFLSEN